MASLTIRKLDEALKAQLRLRAARHGRSVEDEVRFILRDAASESSQPASDLAPAELSQSSRDGGRRRAPRHADHRRRHRRLQVARSDPPAEGPAHARALRADARRAAVRHAAFGQRAGRRALLHRPVRSAERVRRRPHPPCARLRPDRRGARDRRPDGEDGERPCRRSRHRHPARDRSADRAGAGDEPADVVERRRPAAMSRCWPSAARSWSGRIRARWQRPAKRASAACPSRWRSRLQPNSCSSRRSTGPLRNTTTAGDRGPDPRADRSGALHRQPLVGQAGLRHRRSGRSRGRRGQADFGTGRSSRS